MAQRRPKGRPITGIVLMDKASGKTSNRVLQEVKHLFDAQKAGHTGSLDPLATGLLPICLGDATKVSGYLLNSDKTYETTCRLGIRTDSLDSDGQVTETHPVGAMDKQHVEAVLQQFMGEIQQVPPMYSAIKQAGVPLYKLAREGKEVEREARTVHIYSLDLLSLSADRLELRVVCSKGTYIRTLVDDIGQLLGCGAHVTHLRRTQVGPFSSGQLYTFEDLVDLKEKGLLDNGLLNVEEALVHLPDVQLSEDATFYLQQGQKVFVPQETVQGLVRLFDPNCRFLGIGEALEDGRIAPKRLMNLTKVG